jgi:hypothetical protein
MSFVESIIIVDPTKVSTCSLEISYQAFVSKSVNLCNKNVDIKFSVHDFSLASSTTKTGRHDIAEILLKVALNTINLI